MEELAVMDAMCIQGLHSCSKIPECYNNVTETGRVIPKWPAFEQCLLAFWQVLGKVAHLLLPG